MKLMNIEAELHRHKWAIQQSAWNAILGVVSDGAELNPEDYALFHSIEKRSVGDLSAAIGKTVDSTFYTSVKGTVGFLAINGPIIPRATWFTHASGMVSLDVLTKEFQALERNPSIQTIVLMIDSPGGAVIGVSDFAALVRQSSKQTKTFGWTLASAAYWIGCSTQEVILSEGGAAGAVGVVFSTVDRSEALKKSGIKEIEIVSAQSPKKRPDLNTSEGREVYQQEVNDLADLFISTVATNRGVSVATVQNNFGEGAMLGSKRAFENKMVDKVTDLHSFIGSLSGPIKHLVSVKAETKKEERLMDPEDTTGVTETNAAVAAATTTAVNKERERMQGIEALGDKVNSSPQAVQTAVRKVIAEEKYKDTATVATVSALLLDVVIMASNEAVASFEAPRKDAAKIAAFAGTATPTTEVDTAEKAALNRRAKLKEATARRRKVSNHV